MDGTLILTVFGVVILVYILVTAIGCSSSVVKTNFSDANLKEATVYYYLPESMIKITATAKVAVIYNAGDNTLTNSSRVIEQSFQISPEIIGDTRSLLSLNYKPNAFTSDEIKYTVNSMGLLETVDVTTEDETAAIIKELAEAPKIVLARRTTSEDVPDRAVKIKEKVIVKEYHAEFVKRVSELSSAESTIDWNIIIFNEFKDEDPNSISANFQISSEDLGPQARKSVLEILNNSSIHEDIDGVLCRPLKNIKLKIKSSHNGLNVEFPFYITVADASKLINVPIRRTPFVKRVNTLSLKNGILISNEINKPSSVKAAVSIPIDIAKALVAIPGQLVSFRFDNTKQRINLEKQKQILEKSLIDAQKDRIKASKNLEDLKKEIQKLSEKK